MVRKRGYAIFMEYYSNIKVMNNMYYSYNIYYVKLNKYHKNKILIRKLNKSHE